MYNKIFHSAVFPGAPGVSGETAGKEMSIRMHFFWMEDIPWLKRIKDAINLRHRLGNLFWWLPKTGLVEKAGHRKQGISVYLTVKNEAQWIEPTIRSLAPFVDQISFIDNGSTDDTVSIIEHVMGDLDLDYSLELHPDADFGVARDHALKNTTCSWILRWDGDIICRTQGSETFRKIRDFIFSLDQDCFYAVYIPLVQIDGDLFHQNTERPVFSEDWLLTWSPKMYHTTSGKMRELQYPFYYKRIYFRATVSFHMWGLDSPEMLVVRSYLEPWRKQDDFEKYPTRRDYALDHIREDYGVTDISEAGALYCRERFRTLVPYDAETYGPYPEILDPYRESFPLRVVYRNGKPAGRNDFMDTLDRLDAEMMKTPVDVIVSTRGRPDMVLDTVRALLAQEYPRFRVVVVDQNDDPVTRLGDIARDDPRLVHHVTETRGLPAGRNEGLSISEADIVIFVDDDIVPEPGFIRGHVLMYRDSSVTGTAGRVTERREEMNAPVPAGRIGKVDRLTGAIYRGFTGPKPVGVDTAQGVNMSFRRDALMETGGFDTRLGGAFLYEETDVCLTLAERGGRIVYAPDAGLLHLGAPTGGCRIGDAERDIYWYAHNFTLLFRKHFPRSSFPVWFSIRMGKFLRDCLRRRSPRPLLAGVRGMIAGARSYAGGVSNERDVP